MTVALAGDPAAVGAVSDVLRERIAAQELAVAFETVPTVDPAVVLGAPSKEEAFARAWIDLRGETQSTLYLVDGKGERVLIRAFARQQNPEVTYEAIGHVVELAVTSLRAGALIGIGRDRARAELLPETPAPTPPAPTPPAAAAREAPTPAPAPRGQTRFSGGVFYEAQAYGGLDVWSGPGGLVEVRRRPARGRFSFGALAAAQYRLPAESETTRSPILRFEGAAASVLATGGVALSRPGELVLGLGPGLEALDVEARGDRAADVRLVAGDTQIAGLFRMLVRYEHALPGVRLTAGVGADVPFERTRYLIAGPTGATVLFEAWPVRPFFSFGIQMP